MGNMCFASLYYYINQVLLLYAFEKHLLFLSVYAFWKSNKKRDSHWSKLAALSVKIYAVETLFQEGTAFWFEWTEAIYENFEVEVHRSSAKDACKSKF